MKLLLLVFGRAHQQIVEHVVVPVGHTAPIQSIRSQAGFIQLCFVANISLHIVL